MIGFLAQDVCMNKMVKTKNRYIPLNVGQVGCWHFLAIEKSASVQMPIVAFTQEYSRVLNP
jgi:hypothetical protein